MESSQTKILLLDSSKFSKICPTTFAYLSDFDIIVTDDELSAEWQAILPTWAFSFCWPERAAASFA